MQDHSSDVSVSGKIMFHADGFWDVHRGKRRQQKQTNKSTKKGFPFQFTEIWFLFLIKALILAFGAVSACYDEWIC